MNKRNVLIAIGIAFVLFLAYQRIFKGEEIDRANALRATQVATEDSLATLLEEATSKSKLESESSTKLNSSVLNKVLKEPKVLDAIITEANVLYVSVKDDGTRRDGYADYLCQVLKENGLTDTTVKVVKHNSSKSPDRDNAYGVLLGQSSCSF